MAVAPGAENAAPIRLLPSGEDVVNGRHAIGRALDVREPRCRRGALGAEGVGSGSCSGRAEVEEERHKSARFSQAHHVGIGLMV